ncbi:DUF5682 family protein [Acinetobacter larvae]|uniref:4-aminobutyrate aminotransferase n=1 Tax=Acinetobacter larvae TaxID=1789224 RepID=A0A1B2LX57_9GAMM|nr:DUF5682 family protein [Acinetobacter larvae]AOA57363.1 hypothetical protein BFG52_02645 [Acinetobacter larvae]
MTTHRTEHWPERLQQAMQAKQQLQAEQQLYFAPIRHHSPACAYALQHYIAQLQPTHILIEAPTSFAFLLPSLLDAQTQPPIAIFAQAHARNKTATATKAATKTTTTHHAENSADNNAENSKVTAKQDNAENQQLDAATDEVVEEAAEQVASAYFPFCDYSPEWVALQHGQAFAAKIDFIDLPWHQQSELSLVQQQLDQQQRSLMSERYLAHSDYIQQLAQRLHCRNHDELWDHLFELQTPDKLQNAATFFDDVLVWCSLARLDYEPEVLRQDASLAREAQMWQKIQAYLAPDHRVLVITGGFHSIALIEHAQSSQQSAQQAAQQSAQQPIQQNVQQDAPATVVANTDTAHIGAVNEGQKNWQEQAWLIRYSFDRLDALNGYASGMPSPAYYQNFWQQLQAGTRDLAQRQHDFLSYLSLLCSTLQQQESLDINRFLAIRHTAEIAWRLADLRGHYQPSRYDLLDALQSALIKGEIDDGQQHLLQEIYRFLSGQQLGQVPANQHQPALLRNVYQQIEQYRFKLSDTLSRQRKLDVFRKPLHQQISQFLHLLAFVGCDFAQCLSGPDYVNGAGLDLLFEEWRYAWTPSVEARLLELAEHASQLSQIAVQKLLAQQQHNQQQGLGQSAAETAKLLALACRLGLKQQLQLLRQQLSHYIQQEQNLGSLISAAQQLYYLWHGRTLLQLPAQQLLDQLQLALQHSCLLLEQLYDAHEEKVAANLQHLKQLHELIVNTAAMMPDAKLLTLLYQQIDRQRLQQFHLSPLLGALDVLQFLDQRIDQAQLSQRLKQSFATGSQADQSVQYLQGMFFIAPEIFVQSPIAIEALYQLVSGWSEEDFIQILPDLRYAFSQLNPKQSQTIAEKIATLSGLSSQDVLDQVFAQFSEQDMLQGLQLNQQLQHLYGHDQLQDWFENHAAHTTSLASAISAAPTSD